MARRPSTDPANRDITHSLLARTGFASIAEMSKNVMFATKAPLNPWGKQPFRPGVPAKLINFDELEIDGKPCECMILEYVDGLDGETVEHPHPLNTMFTELEFIPTSECTMTYIRKSRLEKGL